MKRNTIILIISLSGFVSAADNWIVSLILPAISQSFNISIPTAGAIIITYLIPYGIMQPFYGFYSDGYGKIKILRVIVAALSLSTLATALSPTFIFLCIFRFITGFFAAGIIAVSLGIIGDLVASNERQIYVGKFMGIVFLGQGLSSGLGGFLVHFLNWRFIFGLFSIIALLSFFLLTLLPISPTKVKAKRHFYIEIKKLLYNTHGIKIYLLAFINGFLILGIYSFLGSFLNIQMHINYIHIGLIIMLFGFACFFIGSQIKIFTKRITKKQIILIGYMISFVSSLLLLLFPRIYISGIAAFGLGTGYILVQSVLASSALDLSSESKGLSSAIIGVGIFGGGGLGTLFGSFLLSLGNFTALFLIFSCLLLVPIFIVLKNKKYIF